MPGTDGNAGQAGYGAGKAGVVGLTKVLSKEWGRYNVNVNAVGFGLINTRMVQPLGAEQASFKMRGQDIKIGVQAAVLDQVKEKCSLGRVGSPEEAAGAVLFMCSPLSDYVTGEVLIASGGVDTWKMDIHPWWVGFIRRGGLPVDAGAILGFDPVP